MYQRRAWASKSLHSQESALPNILATRQPAPRRLEYGQMRLLLQPVVGVFSQHQHVPRLDPDPLLSTAQTDAATGTMLQLRRPFRLLLTCAIHRSVLCGIYNLMRWY